MAINFPNSPSVNDIHSEGGIRWKWNGSSWTRASGAAVTDTITTANDNSTTTLYPVMTSGTGGQTAKIATTATKNISFDASDGNLTVGGNISAGGTITYEDVRNVDSLGIGTFVGGIRTKHSSSGKYASIHSNAAGAAVVSSDPDNNANNSSVQFHVDGTEAGRFETDRDFTVGNPNAAIGYGATISSVGNITAGIITARGNILVPSGKIGIGTDDAGRALTLRNAEPRIRLIDDDTGSFSEVYTDNTGHLYLSADAGLSNGGSRILFNVDGSEKGRINNSGQVGISTSANFGDAKLTVEGVTTLANTDQTIMVRDSNSDDAVGRGGNIGFGAYVNGTMRTLGAIGAVKQNAGNSFNGGLTLYTRRNAEANLDERLRITSAGDVGIGTNIPGGDLHIYDDDSSSRIYLTSGNSDDCSIYFGRVNDTATAAIRNDHSDNSLRFYGYNNSERLRIDSSGRLLLGTTTEGAGTYAETFTIAGTTHCGMTIRSATNGVGSIYFSDGTSGDSEYRGYIEYNHTSDFFKIATAATERLRITSAGSVNIGSASGVLSQTTFKAQIETATNKLISFGAAEHDDLSDEGAGIIFSRPSDGSTKISGIFQHTNQSLGVASRGGLTFHTGGSSFYSAADERLRITSGGDVTIGNSSVAFPSGGGLQVYNATAPRIKLTNSTTGVASGDGLQIYVSGSSAIFDQKENAEMRFYTNATERLRITSTGEVGINADNPNSLLEVRGTAGTYTNGVTVFTGNTTHSGSNAKNGVGLYSFGDALKGGLSSNLLYSNSSTPSQSYTTRSSGQIEITNTTAANKTSEIKFGGYYKGTTTFVERLRITSGGDVLIGTTTAITNTPLVVQGSGTTLLRVGNTDDGIAGITLKNTGSSNWAIKNEDAHLRFEVANNEKFRIRSNGNVGINETSPDRALHVKSTTDTEQIYLENTASSGRAQARFVNPHGDWVTGLIGGTTEGDFITYTSAAKNFRVYTNNSERFRITSAGAVQLNSDSGTTYFSVGASQDFKWYHDANGPTIFSDTNNQGLKLSIKDLLLTDYTGNTNQLKIDSSGRVKINHTDHPGQLDDTFLSIYDANSQSGISKNYAMIALHNYGTGSPGDVSGIGFGAGASFAYTKASIGFERTDSYGRGDLVFCVNSQGNSNLVTNTDERFRIKKDSSMLHTRTDNTGRYDLEFRQTGGISDGNYGGIKWTQSSNGSTFLAGIQIAYADTGRPDMIFYQRDRGGSAGSDEGFRLTRDGNLTTCESHTFSRVNAGFTARKGDSVSVTRNGGTPLEINRGSNDGALINFYQANSHEGSVTVSGSSISYGGGVLTRWSQLVGISTNVKSDRPTIYRGTVMSNLDEMCEWTGEENMQLNKTQVSTASGDKNVAGVFWGWDDDDDTYTNDFFVAQTGDYIIRVGAATTVTRGDLLESAGDGTAKPQSDDIVRSKTVAKVTSGIAHTTYADGSKTYPCVLMAS